MTTKLDNKMKKMDWKLKKNLALEQIFLCGKKNGKERIQKRKELKKWHFLLKNFFQITI